MELLGASHKQLKVSEGSLTKTVPDSIKQYIHMCTVHSVLLVPYD